MGRRIADEVRDPIKLARIVALRQEGKTYVEIGKAIGVSNAAIYAQLKRWHPNLIGTLQQIGVKPYVRGPRTAYEAKPGRANGTPSESRLPVAKSDFIKPLSREQLMAGK